MKQAPAKSGENVRRFSPDTKTGLSSQQVKERTAQGCVNIQPRSPSKTIGQIIASNVFTLFNFLNFALAFCVLAVGSYRNLLFIGVILCNIVIGTVQEIRAKKTVEKLSLLSEPKAHILRDGAETMAPMEELVLDDIMLLRPGNQIGSDSSVLEGELEVNESLLTGEAEPVRKCPGDFLLSGSFVVSGHCKAKVEHVGADNYTAKLTSDVKAARRYPSEIMKALNKIIRFVSFVIVPVGIALFCKHFFFLHLSLTDSVVKTVAAVIGMIPEGLILLTSVALAVGVIRLSRRKTLVQELSCIETLARVDVLCLDKTGTITEGAMEVMDILPLENTPLSRIESAVGACVHILQDDNPTFFALKERFADSPDWKALHTVPFSSARKYSGVSFAGQGSYFFGAPEFLLRKQFVKIAPVVEEYSSKGNRVLLLAHTSQEQPGDSLPEDLQPLALFLISDKIRPEAPQTLKFFAEQGVEIKIISGDNPLTVSHVAKHAGLRDAEKCVDASLLKTEQELADAAKAYTVFGRVSPQQKRQLIHALKKQGHTVAMTGDGVNDALALRDADCSIAMASGSDAVRHISQLVLLDSNFASMPQTVMEGRRVINNIQRASSLYLVKTIYSLLLSILLIFLSGSYPFVPIQLTLIGALTIGVPSFFLALEPNRSRIQGDFLNNVLRKALPGALTIVLGILSIQLISPVFSLGFEQMSTLSVLFTGFCGLLTLFFVCRPFHFMRRILWATMAFAFVGAVTLLPGLFFLVPPTPLGQIILIVLCACACVLMPLLARGISRLTK